MDFFFFNDEEGRKNKFKISGFSLEVFSLFSDAYPHFPHTDLSKQKVNYKMSFRCQKRAKLCRKNV